MVGRVQSAIISFFLYNLSVYLFIYFWPRCAACRILVSQPGMEPVPSAVKARSPNHWTARYFPVLLFLILTTTSQQQQGSSSSIFVAAVILKFWKVIYLPEIMHSNSGLSEPRVCASSTLPHCLSLDEK